MVSVSAYVVQIQDLICNCVALQLHMEDLCKKTAEHGIHIWILEANEQGTEAGQAKIH